MSDPSTQPAAASAFARARARAALIAWWSVDDNLWKVLMFFVIGVSLLSVTALIVSIWAGLTGLDQGPIAEQTAVSAPAATAETDLQAQVDALRLRVAALEACAPQARPEPEPSPAQHRASSAPRSTAQRPPQAPSAEPAPLWGTTDLDRAIDDFTPPTTFGAKP